MTEEEARHRRRKRRKKKHKGDVKFSEIQLNIMPFIDVFSILNTFLLMSSVSLFIGMIEVQIPFLAPTPPDQKDPPRSMTVKVDMSKSKIEVTTAYSKPPLNERKKQFSVNERGLAEMHEYLVDVRRRDPETDLVQFYTDDDVIWQDMAAAIDAVKLRLPTDPVFPVDPKKTELEREKLQQFLFPKIVLASVIL